MKSRKHRRMRRGGATITPLSKYASQLLDSVTGMNKTVLSQYIEVEQVDLPAILGGTARESIRELFFRLRRRALDIIVNTMTSKKWEDANPFGARELPQEVKNAMKERIILEEAEQRRLAEIRKVEEAREQAVIDAQRAEEREAKEYAKTSLKSDVRGAVARDEAEYAAALATPVTTSEVARSLLAPPPAGNAPRPLPQGPSLAARASESARRVATAIPERVRSIEGKVFGAINTYGSDEAVRGYVQKTEDAFRGLTDTLRNYLKPPPSGARRTRKRNSKSSRRA